MAIAPSVASVIDWSKPRARLSTEHFERLVSALAVVIGWEAMTVLHDTRSLSRTKVALCLAPVVEMVGTASDTVPIGAIGDVLFLAAFVARAVALVRSSTLAIGAQGDTLALAYDTPLYWRMTQRCS